MKPKENFIENLLIVKKEDKEEQKGKIFPLGYTDKRAIKKRKHRKSHNSSKSGSSESIEEKNEELEDEDNNKNNSDPEKKNELLINDENLQLFPINDSDSDSEIIEEEIITEETIAKIYADKTDQIFLEENKIDLNRDISPLSETVIVKKNNQDMEDNTSNSNDKIIIKEKKRRILKYKDNLLFKYFNHKSLIAKMRIITLIILIVYIALIIISIFFYGLKKNKLTIFCFEFIENDKKYNKEKYARKLFLSDRNSIITVQALCGIPFLSIIISLIKNEYLPLKQFFKETSFYFPLTMVINIPIFIIGLIKDEYENSDGSVGIALPIIFTLLTLIGFLSMTFILLTARERKYKSISNLINISILCSFFSSFECYSFLYSVCLLIRAIYDKPMYIPEIIMGIIYFLFGIFIIVSFKDIFYVFILVIINLGLLYIKKNIAVTIINLTLTFFGFAVIIINIFKYKKKVFGFLSKDL
jgi:hypothetical protein